MLPVKNFACHISSLMLRAFAIENFTSEKMQLNVSKAYPRALYADVKNRSYPVYLLTRNKHCNICAYIHMYICSTSIYMFPNWFPYDEQTKRISFALAIQYEIISIYFWVRETRENMKIQALLSDGKFLRGFSMNSGEKFIVNVVREALRKTYIHDENNYGLRATKKKHTHTKRTHVHKIV